MNDKEREAHRWFLLTGVKLDESPDLKPKVSAVRKRVDTSEAYGLSLPKLQKPKMERAEAIRWKLQGKSYREIGRLMGCTGSRAQQLCAPTYKDRRIGGASLNCSGNCHHITAKEKTVENYS